MAAPDKVFRQSALTMGQKRAQDKESDYSRVIAAVHVRSLFRLHLVPIKVSSNLLSVNTELESRESDDAHDQAIKSQRRLLRVLLASR